jgi:hypothetical protein
MKPAPISYPKVILALLAWLTCIIVIYAGCDHDNLYTYFANRVLVGIASIITLIVFFRDNSRYKREQDLKAFAATITAGICVMVLLLTIWMLNERDNTRTNLSARNSRKLSYVIIDLRDNNTFKITDKRLFSAEYIRGPYFFRDSVLLLTGASVKNVLKTNSFVTRTIHYNDSIKIATRSESWEHFFRAPQIDTTSNTILIPIDDQGNIIDSARSFWVTRYPVID